MANQSNFQVQETIRNAIRQIALHGIVNSETGAVVGTGKTVGYVAKIHTDESDELFGTIDVQEYNQLSMDEDNKMELGYHEGVYIGALQDNSSGFVIIPLLYSDVVIDKDNDTGQEYVVMFSHVQHVQIDSHEDISIGVKEREEFDESSEDAPDIHELEETGVFTNTTYTKDTITTEVHKDKDSHVSKQVFDGESMKLTVDDEATSVSIDKDKVSVERDQATVTVKSDGIEQKVGQESVKVSSSGVEVGGGVMEDAVLGQKLMQMLSQLLTILSTAMTSTMLGPQPLIPAGQIAALQNQLKPFLSTHVKIQS